MKENYNEFAANWWTEKIQQTQAEPIYGLDLFKEELSSKIKSFTASNPSMTISTYQTKSTLLDEIAFRSGLLHSNIPSGYEMRILFDSVRVYNSSGKLVASF